MNKQQFLLAFKRHLNKLYRYFKKDNMIYQIEGKCCPFECMNDYVMKTSWENRFCAGMLCRECPISKAKKSFKDWSATQHYYITHTTMIKEMLEIVKAKKWS